MRSCILGVDPGSRHTGYGIVVEEGQRFVTLAYGTITPSRTMAFAERLGHIYREVDRIISSHGPTAMVVEGVFVAKNVRSALQLGQARGAALVAAVNRGVPIFEYSPLEVKQALVGYGMATKDQVEKMVRLILRIEGAMDSHSADALALTICHFHRSSPPRPRGLRQ